METDGSFKKSDIYARVTDEIVRAIEAGVKDYEMPWHQRAGAGLPRNASTGNFYREVNTVALWSTSRLRGYLQEIAAKKQRAALPRGRFRINLDRNRGVPIMNVSSSLKFSKCIITLPDGEELPAQLKYEPAAYMQGSGIYPANIVVFKAKETCKLERFGLKDGWGAEFIQECINYAICEGDDIEGVVEEICANGGGITWKLVGEA